MKRVGINVLCVFILEPHLTIPKKALRKGAPPALLTVRASRNKKHRGKRKCSVTERPSSPARNPSEAFVRREPSLFVGVHFRKFF
jgi:hypothetical protein